MNPEPQSSSLPSKTVEPLCPVFGVCGGCSYQNIPYAEELAIKEGAVRALLCSGLGLKESVILPVTASPEPYHYRTRLDLTMKRSRQKLLMGFQEPKAHKMVTVEACPIARREISDFIPELRKKAEAKLPADYLTANLAIKTGDDGRVLWGGIGRRSLQLQEKDYLWTAIHGKKIYYSLDTFFQANHSILPSLMETIRRCAGFDSKTVFYDLYAGVGLFGVYFADQVERSVMLESDVCSVRVMKYNAAAQGLKNVDCLEGRTEEMFPALLSANQAKRQIAIIDPPRHGLSPTALAMLQAAKQLEKLLYLSCHPESLLRDLKVFTENGWRIEQGMPFDFFPKTEHLETLVVLRPS